MDQRVQCPVCTLYLHSGMSLASHLDTHPKDQVIKALCSLSAKNYGSRSTTPLNSERSYRSRSRTPVTDDSGRWGNSHRDSDRYWRRTPSRNKSTPLSSTSRNPTPDIRIGNVSFENPHSNNNSNHGSDSFTIKSDKTQKTFGSNGQLSVSDYDPQFPFYPEQQDDTEIKFSRSSDYSAQVENSNPIFGYNMPVMGPGVKFPTGMIPTVPRRGGDFTKILPKQGNLLVKTNMSGMQYVSPGSKPMHVMMPTPPSFVQKKLQNNVLMTGNMPGNMPVSPMIDPKHMMPPMNPLSSHVNPINAGAFTPGTTVVTQNSQIIYREMVHNIDGKPYMSNMPPTLGGHGTVTNVAQSSSMYQNVMVVDQFGNTSCMYTTPQHLLPKPPMFNESILPCKQNMPVKTAQNVVYDAKKTLIIEVSPMSSSAPKTANEKSQNSQPSQQSMNSMSKKPEKKKNVRNMMDVNHHANSSCMYTTPQNLLQKPCSSSMFNESIPPYMENLNKSNKTAQSIKDSNKTLVIEVSPASSDVSISTDEECQNSQQNTKPVNKKLKKKKNDHKTMSPGPSKGLKIISNVKVEVPVQNHKNMLNNAMDLPNSTDSDYPEPSITPEKILPDLDDDSPVLIIDKCNQRSSANVETLTSNTFATVKSSSNQSYKDLSPKPILVETKPDTELSDSCPVPDLICNEKPSISPCSELSEQGDNSIDHTLLIPRPESSRPYQSSPSNNIDICKKPSKTQKNALRHNNIFVKKQKKVLQIKNSKLGPPERNGQTDLEAKASSSSFRKSPENFSITKNRQPSSIGETKPSLQPINIEKIKANTVDDRNEFDANTEEQSMDIEPVTPSNMTHSNQFSSSGCMVQIKEEVNSSNELSNEAVKSPAVIAPMEALRPINVVNYSNMADFDDDSNHKELLELDATSKTKQFVSMMNENYFGDNIYADYFTPDRGETFEAQKESNYVWGEPSQKESEFVLPNFIHESYKIAESNGMDYTDVGAGIEKADGDGDKCERDSKADVLSEGEPPLNICADEKMPPRGEISGQESNGDMDSHWSGMLSGVPPAEPYDLMARESWVSDGSDVEVNEKRENIEESLRFPKARMFNCAQCGGKFPSLKELRAHKALVHALPTCSNSKTSYSRLMTARAIKKEEKPYEHVMAGNLSLDSKENIASALLQAYNQFEARPKVERLLKLKQIKKRRKSFMCPTCKVDFITGPAFHAHLKIHPLECLTCGKCFTRRANLALHMKTHLGIKNYKCDICEKGFITRQKLAEHHNVHTGRTPVKCTLCDDTFRRYSNMVQHRNRHHFKKKAKIRDFVCHCGLVFPSRAKLLWHKETHDEKPKACAYCSDKFVHAALLTRHVRRTHNEHFVGRQSKENVPCPICKQIYLRSKMRAHIQTHSGKRPYNCVICNKGFTTKWNLKLHRWIHLSRSAKPYKCNLCKSAFVRHAEYVAHMNSHKSVRPYTCNYCGCQFIRKYNCQRHVREHEMAKKYVCKVPECGKTFHRSYYLSEHMKVHSGVRPYSCNICGKTSSNKSNHNKHVKIHHAREPVATEA